MRHRAVRTELNGEMVERKVVKGDPQGGILSLFLWNCALNSLPIDLRNKSFRVGYKPLPMVLQFWSLVPICFKSKVGHKKRYW